ncbi:UDP-N-acetylglucosamine 1-carboxyvinyltransferase [Candidatus Bipolaricaulota bacterium]|nr:UDP-N-acetylglucosamine 1-carboxyvinyltransferase [Candidatus Bipolaricaulota bacterium]
MTEKLTIRGGKTLEGKIEIAGAKNSALPLIAATLLTEKEVYLENVPRLDDVQTMLNMVRELGKDVTATGPDTVRITGAVSSNQAPAELVRKMRASFLVLAPLLGKTGRAEVPLPGGCNIGTRPVNLHLQGLKRLGVEINQDDGRIIARANNLRSNDIFLDYPSVGATEQLLMAAVCAKGKTTIYNGAQEPEIRDLALFLTELGADLSLKGSVLTVNGGSEFGKGNYKVLSDRIAAGTYMLAGVATGGKVKVESVDPSSIKPLSLKLRKAGVKVEENERSIQIESQGRPDNLEVITLPFPGFPTDLQAPITSVLTLAKGKSVVKETVFDSRFGHVAELSKMGADISVTNSNTVFIEGKNKLRGTEVEATDIRAGASLVIAGLAAEGKTEVSGMKHLDRGYSELQSHLESLGATIERVSENG